MRIKETCSCGASIEVEGASSLAENRVDKWRKEHIHLPRPYTSYSGGSIGYQGGAVITNCATEGVDYVFNGDGERVKI